MFICFSPYLCRVPCRHRAVGFWVGGLYAKVDLKSSEMAWNELQVSHKGKRKPSARLLLNFVFAFPKTPGNANENGDYQKRFKKESLSKTHRFEKNTFLVKGKEKSSATVTSISVFGCFRADDTQKHAFLNEHTLV